MPIDYTTPAGQVRLLIPDTDPTNQLFDDDQLNAFVTIEAGIIKRAAAAALETAASNTALVAKVITTQDLATDGAKVSDALLKRAAELRRQVDEDDPATAGGIDIVDFVDPFTRPLWGHELTESEWWC